MTVTGIPLHAVSNQNNEENKQVTMMQILPLAIEQHQKLNQKFLKEQSLHR